MNTATSTNMNSRLMMIVTSDENILHQVQSQFNPSSFQTIILGSDSQNNEHSKTSSADEQEPTEKSLVCVVCDAPALGRNFGVVACESCKLFFRRNGLKDETKLVCLRDNNCDLKSDTHRRCLPCRLRKCLSSGMKRDRLLKAEEKAAKRLKQAQEQSEQAPSTVPDPVIMLEDMNVFEPPVNQSLLTPDDLERIEAIRVAFENRIELASRDGFGNGPQEPIASLMDHFNKHSVAAVRLLEFFKQIPEFNELNVEDRLTLTKYNIMCIIAIYYAASFRKVTMQDYEVDANIPWNRSIMGSIHGDEILSEIKRIFLPLLVFSKSDDKCVPLVLIVFILLKGISSTGDVSEPSLLDAMSVYRAHNFYTELLWKYWETTYGFQKASQIMSKLVTRFLSWQIVRVKMRSNVLKRLAENNVDKLSPLMKSLFHV